MQIRLQIIVGALVAMAFASYVRAADNPSKQRVFDLGGDVKMEFVLIPAGSFMMGDEQGNENEKPVHRVTIAKPFYLGKHEVTQEQWERLMGRNPSSFKGPGNPVENVNWHDCQTFLKRLHQKLAATGARFHLPTEAQWEYACRAGGSCTYCFGDAEENLGEYAWFNDNADCKHHPVGQKKSNAWGLYDMHGNVWEWCADWYGACYYSQSPATDPIGLRCGVTRSLRGGCWAGAAPCCRAAYRHALADPAKFHNSCAGLRLACSAEPRANQHQTKMSLPRREKHTTVCLSQQRVFDLGGGVNLELVLIPAGSFMMGDANGRDNEKPVHKVTITRPFYLGKCEVTQHQWEKLMGANPSVFKGPEKPVANVSWHDCQAFLEKLNRRLAGDGARFSLPTEAQWEHACRAGGLGAYCFGDAEGELGEHAWFCGSADCHPQPVGQKRPNAWGLYDMHGNVWEWCADWHGACYYTQSPACDPMGPCSGITRVMRGGGWSGLATVCRTAYRADRLRPTFHDNLGGLRVAYNVCVTRHVPTDPHTARAGYQGNASRSVR